MQHLFKTYASPLLNVSAKANIKKQVLAKLPNLYLTVYKVIHITSIKTG
jgi:hypothetical protein